MHIIFYNKKYGSFTEATASYQTQPDALVVLGIFVDVCVTTQVAAGLLYLFPLLFYSLGW